MSENHALLRASICGDPSRRERRRSPSDFMAAARKKIARLFLDVNDADGPDSYVQRSHKLDACADALAKSDVEGVDDDRRAEILQRSYVDNGNTYPLDEASAAYTPHLAHTQTDPAGSLLLSEQRGIDRGEPVRSDNQLTFSVDGSLETGALSSTTRAAWVPGCRLA